MKTMTNHSPKKKTASVKKAAEVAPIPPTPAQALKTDLRTLADDTVNLARYYVLNPVVEAAEDTRDLISLRAETAERHFKHRMERTARWIAANPFAAVGCSVAFGFIASRLMGRSK